MGVPGLWTILAIAMQERALSQFAVTEGFEGNRHGCRSLRLGVDASLWFVQCQHAVAGFTHAQSGENPELRIIFWRLARFLQTTVTLLFVFDGRDRPVFKRGKTVLKKPHWLTEAAKELILAFGFQYYTAPGEAEAELAYLNQKGAIDAILTDDSDAFLFGATHVIRNPKIHDDGDAVEIYTARAIFSTFGVRLSRGSMILIALLSGGDYDTIGLAGCGVPIALALSRTGLGDTLLDAALGSVPEELDEFLAGWRNNLRHELSTDESGFLGSRRKVLANSIRDTFPDPNIIYMYTAPVTSWSHGRSGPKFDFSTLKPRQPDLARLASICGTRFSWRTSSEIHLRFERRVWEGACIKMLCESNWDDMGSINPSLVARIRAVRLDPSPALNFKSFRIQYSLEEFFNSTAPGLYHSPLPQSKTNSVSATGTKINSESPEVRSKPQPEFANMWVPASILRSALPDMVEGFRDHIILNEQLPPPLLSPLHPVPAQLKNTPCYPSNTNAIAGPSNWSGHTIVDASNNSVGSGDSGSNSASSMQKRLSRSTRASVDVDSGSDSSLEVSGPFDSSRGSAMHPIDVDATFPIDMDAD